MSGHSSNVTRERAPSRCLLKSSLRLQLENVFFRKRKLVFNFFMDVFQWNSMGGLSVFYPRPIPGRSLTQVVSPSLFLIFSRSPIFCPVEDTLVAAQLPPSPHHESPNSTSVARRSKSCPTGEVFGGWESEVASFRNSFPKEMRIQGPWAVFFL